MSFLLKMQTKTVCKLKRMTNYKGEKMNKAELIAELADKVQIPKATGAKVVDALIEVITNTLKKGESISLTGFGVIEVAQRAARTGRNPQTGQTIQIKASKVVRFKVGKHLKDAVNGK